MAHGGIPKVCNAKTSVFVSPRTRMEPLIVSRGYLPIVQVLLAARTCISNVCDAEMPIIVRPRTRRKLLVVSRGISLCEGEAVVGSEECFGARSDIRAELVPPGVQLSRADVIMARNLLLLLSGTALALWALTALLRPVRPARAALQILNSGDGCGRAGPAREKRAQPRKNTESCSMYAAIPSMTCHPEARDSMPEIRDIRRTAFSDERSLLSVMYP